MHAAPSPQMPQAIADGGSPDLARLDLTCVSTADMVEQAWRIVQPLLDAWEAEPPAFPNYASGSEGPEAADRLLADADHRGWRPVGATPEIDR